MVHDGEVCLLVREGVALVVDLLVRFVFSALVFFHLLPVLLELDVVLSLFDLIHVLVQAYILLVGFVIVGTLRGVFG